MGVRGVIVRAIKPPCDVFEANALLCKSSLSLILHRSSLGKHMLFSLSAEIVKMVFKLFYLVSQHLFLR